MHARALIFVVCLFISASAVPSAAQGTDSLHLVHYATDLTGTLTTAEIQKLNDRLSGFDKQTSTQIVVLMVSTIGNGSLEDASLRAAEANGIGRKGKSNGALLFIAKDDRKVRIEVGYGLEGALPDITAGQIIRHELAPHFRTGDYFAGISAAVEAMILATKDEYKAEPEKKPGVFGFSPFVILLIIFFVVLRSMFRRPRLFGGRRRPTIFGGWGGGGFGGGGFGGGGFGGGGGGFSGGGGSFGGGGASGSW